ncbi:MEDS domain-containing protein [Halopiger djelfimassiliensis]|uniref:MEDS domain-containing protein n=1 Tax=Halopiger djelfimassiliensis TaxID=1293047 RepID=UPI0006775FD5|nr:MEDS domain-containing protein [Halopiger djelfimassiliensis]
MTHPIEETSPDEPGAVRSGLEALRESPQFRGPVEHPDGHDHANDHLALLYEDHDAQFASVVPFVRQGLERGERCLYVADDNSREAVREAMQAGGIDVDAATQSGALSIHTKAETYLDPGEFDREAMLEFWERSLERATDEGYAGIRAAAEMTWALDSDTSLDLLVEYESILNSLYEDEEYVVLCQYNCDRFPAAVIHDVIRTHPHLIHDGVVSQNAYYTPPAEFFGPDCSAREVERMMQTLRERTEARRELQRTKEHFEKIFDHSQDAIFINDPRADEILEVNPAGCEMLGYTREELLALGPSHCHPHEMDRFQSFVDTVFADGGGWTDELACLPKTGDPIPAEISASPIEIDGRRCLLAIVRDISERKERERAQQRLYEIAADPEQPFDDKLQALFELGCDRFDLELGGMARIDPDSDLFEVEATSGPHEHLAPGTQLDLSETYCRVFDGGDGTACIADPVAEGFENTRAYDEFGVKSYLGTRIPLENDLDRTLFFVADEPRPEGFSEVDRTFHRLMGQWVQYELQRRQYERDLEETVARLQQSNARLEEFAYAASHDLQEPLRMVSSYLRLIEKRYDEALDEDGREFLEFAVNSADRMSAMIQGLLDYSRVETRGDPFEPVDLDAVLEDVRTDLRLRIEESDAIVEVDVLPRVRGDASQLHQLFQNLLDNAIEYSGDAPPTIDVTAERENEQWTILVRDDGIGIDPEAQDRIFEVFQRLHSHEEHEGTGIGLALCQRIAERHGGDITVESEPGIGTTFAVTLPAANTDDR